MRDPTRCCAAVGCKADIPPGRLFCRHHLDGLPKHLRSVIIASCQQRSDGAVSALKAARDLLMQKDGLWVASLLIAVALITAVPTGAAADPAWLNRALSDIGTNPTGWSHKWCARWLDMVVPGGAGNASASWKSYGSPSTARPGAIAVMRGHVGIVGPKGCNGGRCQIVSGNHSGKSGRRTVGLGSYSMGRIISFRWPHQ